MSDPNLIVLYVDDPAASAQFYRELLDRDPLEAFPTYVAFSLGGGFTLGLWSTKRVQPPPPTSGNRTELAFMVESEVAVHALHRQWCERGVTIELAPHQEVFGLNFVALDPDGHRIRVCLFG